MAPDSSTLAWKIPWTEEPGGLQSMGSRRFGHGWVTSLHFSLSCIGEGNGNPLQCSCLENPRDGGAWWAAIYGVAQSQTRLKRLSSSSHFSRYSRRDMRTKLPEFRPVITLNSFCWSVRFVVYIFSWECEICYSNFYKEILCRWKVWWWFNVVFL